MKPVLILVAICAGVWYLVKQTAIVFERPEWWDHADLAAGGVGAIGFAYIQYPYVWGFEDPIGMLAYRALVFGVGVALMTMMLGLPAENEGLLRTPESLAPIKARVHGKGASVDELDDETLAEYTEQS